MRKTVRLNPTESNLVKLAYREKEQAEKIATAAFNAAISPLADTYGVTGNIALDVGADGTITMNWDEPEPEKAPIRARRNRKVVTSDHPALVSA